MGRYNLLSYEDFPALCINEVYLTIKVDQTVSLILFLQTGSFRCIHSKRRLDTR